MFDPRLDHCEAPDAGRLRALLQAIPAPLKGVLDGELARGNRVLRIDSGFPAPPVGACVVLERPLDPSTAISPDGPLHWRSWPNWNGWFGCTDAQARIFLVGPSPSEDAVAPVERDDVEAAVPPQALPLEAAARGTGHVDPPREAQAGAALQAFRASMQLDYERWREGIGYDLDALDRLAQHERAALEAELAGRGARGWRDVEALARLDGPVARAALLDALVAGGHEVRMTVMHQRPDIGTPRQRLDALLRAIAGAAPFDGLSATLSVVEEFHPPAVIDALWAALRERDGDIAVHFAAMLTFLHGEAASRFDWAQRPIFLRFNTADPALREQAIEALRQRLGRPPG